MLNSISSCFRDIWL